MAKNEILPLTRDRRGPLDRIKGEPDRRTRHRVPASVQAQRLGGSVGLSFTNILDRDDIEVADLFQHPLTVVTYDAGQIGLRSAELLFARLADRESADGTGRPTREVISTALVHYHSH